ncbi:hypothetical protein CW362_09850 [Streptomyces populi]|uniref:Uncharacterized protein n=1 Tax=Streptomyces populi TaxID=2058924 RepID=A0A2I0STH7_9ACTN|nr:hypothetical protein [Streptomyces populi]PKT73229.1 hypothetical protein CW362_09850 [Streptomyces populi]
MAAHLRSEDGWLLVGDRRIVVEVDLGLFLPDTGLWGGVLRNIPRGLASSVRDVEARLQLQTGQARRIRLLAGPDDETSVPFIGEGSAPF